ncbi:MAG: hypothetical protein ABIO04_12835 [Ferruginibacter sp.]
MKCFKRSNWLIAVLLFCGFSQAASSQSLNEFFNNSEMHLVYLGVDFTQAKLINAPDANSFDIRNRLYGSINDLVVNEPKKFDIAGAFHKSFVGSDLTAVKERNGKINAEEIVSSNSADFDRLKENDVAGSVKKLSIDRKEGIGLLFVMEGMKKVDKKGEAALWVVLIDMKSKKLLMAERFVSKATGIGFRNYWASTIKETLKEIENKKYKEWKDKYGTSK